MLASIPWLRRFVSEELWLDSEHSILSSNGRWLSVVVRDMIGEVVFAAYCSCSLLLLIALAHCSSDEQNAFRSDTIRFCVKASMLALFNKLWSALCSCVLRSFVYQGLHKSRRNWLYNNTPFCCNKIKCRQIVFFNWWFADCCDWLRQSIRPQASLPTDCVPKLEFLPKCACLWWWFESNLA